MFFLPVFASANADTLVVRYDSTGTIMPISFDKNHIEKYKKDKAFDYNEYKYKNKFWTKVKRWIYNFFLKIFKWLFGQKKAGPYLRIFTKIAPYIGLAALIFVIIRFLFNTNFRKLLSDNDSEAEVIYGEDEEIIRNKDINALLKEAAEKGNYRLALRYYYLKLLKKLEANDIIKWEPQKTNYEYLREIKKQDYNDKFKRFTLWYDYIWYGKYPLNNLEFSAMSEELEDFFKRLAK